MRLLIQSWGRAILILVLSFPSILPGQVKQLNNFYDSNPVNGDICVKAYNFETDASVERLVSQIMEKYGAPNPFVILPCDRTSNAQAIVDDKNRPVILYNPQFLESIKSLSFTTATLPVSPTNWEKLAVIAHEVAHHISYHITAQHPGATSWSMELEADYTAGFILYKFGASLQEAQRVMYSSAVSVEGSRTHPPRAQRLDAIERGWQSAKAQALPDPVIEEVDLHAYDMILVKGGTFQMGSERESGHKSAWPLHTVTLSDFYIGKYEVTNKQWREVMGADTLSFEGEVIDYFRSCNSCPVVGISWHEAKEFIKKLNIKTGQTYRLPTEAEWEYAARGGIADKGYNYAGGNNLDEVAWHQLNAGGEAATVGRKKPNELGLYDFSGNVAEWCQDYFAPYPDEPQVNPKGPSSGKERVARGGSFEHTDFILSSRTRGKFKPDGKWSNFGFRLVREISSN